MKFYLFEFEKHKKYFQLLIEKYKLNMTENSDEADIIISYGGDGTLLDTFQKFPNKTILPIRNYDRCNIHNDNFNFFDTNYVNIKPIIDLKFNDKNLFGISEMVIRNSNVSKAIRFNLKINDQIYAENIIGDGIICATSLGSSGYFKSVTNTIFNDGIGIGFINNTQGMSNLIIDNKSIIEIELIRGNAQLCLDHIEEKLFEKEKVIFRYSSLGISLANYKNVFMCPECRNKRHSAYVNTLYKCI